MESHYVRSDYLSSCYHYNHVVSCKHSIFKMVDFKFLKGKKCYFQNKAKIITETYYVTYQKKIYIRHWSKNINIWKLWIETKLSPGYLELGIGNIKAKWIFFMVVTGVMSCMIYLMLFYQINQTFGNMTSQTMMGNECAKISLRAENAIPG